MVFLTISFHQSFLVLKPENTEKRLKHWVEIAKNKLEVEQIIKYSRKENLVNIKLSYLSITVNGSKMIYKAHIPYLIHEEKYPSNSKFVFVTRKEKSINFFFTQPSSSNSSKNDTNRLVVTLLPFSPILNSRKSDFTVKLFSLFDVCPPPLHYFDDRRQLLSYKANLSYKDISFYTKSKIHNLVFPEFEKDMSEVQDMSITELQEKIKFVAQKYFYELGFQCAIFDGDPSDILDSNQQNPEVLIFLPKDTNLIKPAILCGSNIYKLSTTLKLINDSFISTFQFNDQFFSVSEAGVIQNSGVPCAGEYLAVVYRSYMDQRCVLNIPSFIPRYEKVTVYQFNKMAAPYLLNLVDDREEDKTVEWKLYKNQILDSNETFTDLQLLEQGPNDYYFEFDPYKLILSSFPLPSICGKSVLKITAENLKCIIWINESIVCNNSIKSLTYSQYDPKEENQTVISSNIFTPVVLNSVLYRCKDLINLITTNLEHSSNNVVTNLFDGKIVQRYYKSSDDSINYDFPVVIFQEENGLIPFNFRYFNESEIEEHLELKEYLAHINDNSLSMYTTLFHSFISMSFIFSCEYNEAMGVDNEDIEAVCVANAAAFCEHIVQISFGSNILNINDVFNLHKEICEDSINIWVKDRKLKLSCIEFKVEDPKTIIIEASTDKINYINIPVTFKESKCEIYINLHPKFRYFRLTGVNKSKFTISDFDLGFG